MRRSTKTDIDSDPQIWYDGRGMNGDIFDLLGKAAEPTSLDAGDFMFWGKDPVDGRGILVGVEYKKLHSLLGDIDTSRVALQADRMLDTYDRSWLMVEEGMWKVSQEGFIMFSKRARGGGFEWYSSGHLYSSVDNFYSSIQEHGVKVKVVKDFRLGAKSLLNLYSWYQKDPGQHTMTGAAYQAFTLNGKVPLRRRVASQLSGIGWGKSKNVEDCFPSTRAMVNATVEEWMQVKGIGKVIAERSQRELGEE